MMLYEITAEVMEDYERYLKNRNLTYYRRKTSGRLDIRWEQQMQRRLYSYTFLRLIPQQ